MKTLSYVYIIGTTDDFRTEEELEAAYREVISGGSSEKNFSHYSFEIPEGLQLRGYKTPLEIAAVLGQGEAFNTGWSMDDTLSVLLERK